MEIKKKTAKTEYKKSFSIHRNILFSCCCSFSLTLASHALAKRIIQMIYRINVHEYIIKSYTTYFIMLFIYLLYTHKKRKKLFPMMKRSEKSKKK